MADVAPEFPHSSGFSTKKVKGLLQPYAQKKLLLPILLFLLDGALYVTMMVGAVVASSYWQRIMCGSMAGLAIGMLFVVGHDACHGSYTRHQWLNRMLGRIAFLPALHAFSLWSLGHNQIHHRFTNLKSEDYVWRPYSKAEFDQLPHSRQWLERLYRTMPGLGLYYAVEIWWRKMIFPNQREVPERRAAFFWDSCLVLAFAFSQAVGVIWLGNEAGAPWLCSVTFSLVLPFCVWNWLMGFAIFQHHTHPGVAWFENVEEWNYWESQIAGTTHVRFPKFFSLLFHNIMEHTAHHAFTGVPFYNLIKAQAAIEFAYGGQVKVVPWTVPGFRDTLRQCKLYDYQHHVWTDFEGNVTSAPTVNSPALRTPMGGSSCGLGQRTDAWQTVSLLNDHHAARLDQVKD